MEREKKEKHYFHVVFSKPKVFVLKLILNVKKQNKNLFSYKTLNFHKIICAHTENLNENQKPNKT